MNAPAIIKQHIHDLNDTVMSDSYRREIIKHLNVVLRKIEAENK